MTIAFVNLWGVPENIAGSTVDAGSVKPLPAAYAALGVNPGTWFKVSAVSHYVQGDPTEVAYRIAADAAGAVPSGAASGDLSGTYPGPNVSKLKLGGGDGADLTLNAVTASGNGSGPQALRREGTDINGYQLDYGEEAVAFGGGNSPAIACGAYWVRLGNYVLVYGEMTGADSANLTIGCPTSVQLAPIANFANAAVAFGALTASAGQNDKSVIALRSKAGTKVMQPVGNETPTFPGATFWFVYKVN